MTLRIPYNATGKLSMSVNTSTAFYHKMTKTEYKTSTYNWKIGSTETQGSYYKELDYGITDLDGATVSVYPVITACNRTANGSAATFKIERYIDAKLKLTSNKIVCENENINYKLEGVPNGSVIQWIIGAGVSIVSGQGSPMAVFKSQNLGYNTVTASVTYAGKNYTFKNSEVWVGPPIVQEVPKMNFVIGQTSELSVDFDGLEPSTIFKWTRVSGDIYMSGSIGRSIMITPWDDKYFVIRVDVTNRCGTGSGLYQFKAGSGGLGGGGLNSLNLKSSIVQDSEFTPQSIKVYNLSGAIVHSQYNISGDFDIKSTTLPDGIYIIEKSDGKERQCEKVILKR
ncbi:MAG: T9SS type A sorting domain-containing protein [Dysgonomonas sp.]|uniref:T9SS type A sorting domain-containing protein n=1 Tax=Dysgonomonas sp. TaxID=1891233 RepID=UPI0039E4EDF2